MKADNMREFIYPHQATTATLKDSYNRPRKIYEIHSGANSLPPLKAGYYYETQDGQRFYIYAGTGQLEWQHCQRPYNLATLLNEAHFKELDRFLQDAASSRTPTPPSKAAQEFCDIYAINLSKGSGYLLPPLFEVIDAKLAGHKRSDDEK